MKELHLVKMYVRVLKLGILNNKCSFYIKLSQPMQSNTVTKLARVSRVVTTR